MTTQTSASAMSRLAALATQKPKKGSKAPKPGFTDPALDKAILDFITHKRAMESAEALMKAAQDQITTTGRRQLRAASSRAGEALSSVSVNDRLVLTQQNRYSVVPGAAADDLREAFGAQYEKFFKATFAISLKPESANNEAVLNELMERLGDEFVAEHMLISRDLIVDKAFHAAYLLDDAVAAAADPFLAEQTIKPYSASLKVQ